MLFLICFCCDMFIIIVIEFVYKYLIILGIWMLFVISIVEILDVFVLFDMKSKFLILLFECLIDIIVYLYFCFYSGGFNRCDECLF